MPVRGRHEYMLAASLSAGGIISVSSLQQTLRIGDRLVVYRRAVTTMVKKNWFNGGKASFAVHAALMGEIELVASWNSKTLSTASPGS